MTGADLDHAIQLAATETTAWLRALPEWPNHPTNASGSVASAFPTASGTNPMISVMALAHRTAAAMRAA